MGVLCIIWNFEKARRKGGEEGGGFSVSFEILKKPAKTGEMGMGVSLHASIQILKKPAKNAKKRWGFFCIILKGEGFYASFEILKSPPKIGGRGWGFSASLESF